MRQIFPHSVDVIEPLHVCRDLPVVDGRPAVRLNMAGSHEQAAAVTDVLVAGDTEVDLAVRVVVAANQG